MATPIDRIGLHQLVPTLKALARAGGTTQHAVWIRSMDDQVSHAALLIQFIDRQRDFSEKNPYETSVELQLTALRRANDKEKWGITKEDFARLAATAPAWPKGEHAYRSFRIRFGEGDIGVALTFERHLARIKSVFTDKHFRRWSELISGTVEYEGTPVKRLRLLNGDHTHKAVIEWVIVDLGTHRKRDSIMAVRDSKSLADELLVIAWMFPDMIRAIDCDKFPGLFAAGYVVNIPTAQARHEVIYVTFRHEYGGLVHINCYGYDNNDPGCSVPRLLESPALGA